MKIKCNDSKYFFETSLMVPKCSLKRVDEKYFNSTFFIYYRPKQNLLTDKITVYFSIKKYISKIYTIIFSKLPVKYIKIKNETFIEYIFTKDIYTDIIIRMSPTNYNIKYIIFRFNLDNINCEEIEQVLKKRIINI